MLNVVQRVEQAMSDQLDSDSSLDHHFGSRLEDLLKPHVKLEEDLELAGFVPLMGSPRDNDELAATGSSSLAPEDTRAQATDAENAELVRLFAELDESNMGLTASSTERGTTTRVERLVESIRDRKRMQRMCLFADYLCGLDEPFIK